MASIRLYPAVRLVRSRRCAFAAATIGSIPRHRLSSSAAAPELDVGELPGTEIKIEPMRRIGEDLTTKRARLLYQSRKCGTLESGLLLSTFAAAHLAKLTPAQLDAYDRFLDENDWDIYYWATQEEPSGSAEAIDNATGGAGETRTQNRPGEWANTVGAFKPPYRPVPARWRDSEILALVRQHVKDRSSIGGEGMGFMPDLDAK